MSTNFTVQIIDSDGSKKRLVLGYSNPEPLQRAYGTPEGKAAVVLLLKSCSTQIFFSPAASPDESEG